jgi:hypothetical protein
MPERINPMKKLLLLAVILVLMLSAFRVHGQDDLSQEFDWSDQGFAMLIPEDWSLEEDSFYFNQFNFAQEEDDLEDIYEPADGFTIQLYVFSDIGYTAEEELDSLIENQRDFEIDGGIDSVRVRAGYDIAVMRGNWEGVDSVGLAINGGTRRVFFMWGYADRRGDIGELENLLLNMMDTLVINETIYGVPYNGTFADGGDIEIDDELDGELTDDEVEIGYTIELNAGDEISIRMESDDFDTYLVLIDEDRHQVVVNDDYEEGDTSFSLINGVIIPRDGTYIISVGSYSGEDTGDFTLEVTEGVEENDFLAGEDGRGFLSVIEDEIGYGDSVDGELTEIVDFVGYNFEGSEGDSINIVAESGDFGPSIVLVNEDGEIVAVSQADEGSTALEEFELPDDGVYTLYVGGVDGRPEGDFTVTLEGN